MKYILKNDRIIGTKEGGIHLFRETPGNQGENIKPAERSENSATDAGRSTRQFISETFQFILKDTRPPRLGMDS